MSAYLCVRADEREPSIDSAAAKHTENNRVSGTHSRVSLLFDEQQVTHPGENVKIWLVNDSVQSYIFHRVIM